MKNFFGDLIKNYFDKENFYHKITLKNMNNINKNFEAEKIYLFVDLNDDMNVHPYENYYYCIT